MTTLIPKKIFKKPTHTIFEKGMVTSSKLEFVKPPLLSFTLISYYNPNYNDKPFLSKNTINEHSHIDNLIIVGDFNEIIKYNRDFNKPHNNNQQSTTDNKIIKSKRFKTIINNANLHYKTINDSFTFCSKSKGNII